MEWIPFFHSESLPGSKNPIPHTPCHEGTHFIFGFQKGNADSPPHPLPRLPDMEEAKAGRLISVFKGHTYMWRPHLGGRGRGSPQSILEVWGRVNSILISQTTNLCRRLTRVAPHLSIVSSFVISLFHRKSSLWWMFPLLSLSIIAALSQSVSFVSSNSRHHPPDGKRAMHKYISYRQI